MFIFKPYVLAQMQSHFVAVGGNWAEPCPQMPKIFGTVGLKFSRSNAMESQSRNLTKQKIFKSKPLILYLVSMTIAGTFFIENSIASEINAPNSTPLLSKNPPPIDLSEFKCGDVDEIYRHL